MNLQTQGLSWVAMVPKTKIQVSSCPFNALPRFPRLLLPGSGNSPWEVLLLPSDFGVTSACSDTVSASSLALRRVWLHTFLGSGGRQMLSEEAAGSPFPLWHLGNLQGCSPVLVQSHFPLASSELSASNRLWWDLSPETVISRWLLLLKPALRSILLEEKSLGNIPLRGTFKNSE